MKDREKRQESNPSAKESVLSMIFSLSLVGCVFLFMAGLKFYLGSHTYHGEAAVFSLKHSGNPAAGDYLLEDKKFEPGYIMIKNVPDRGYFASEIPGKKTDTSESLKNGQLLRAVKKGTYRDETYYKLMNGLYVRADKKCVEKLTSYEKLEGYVVITYISSSGVRLRSWADFQADNVVKSVYVGDKVKITGKVINQKGESAFLTENGFYLTTDIRYFNDYTVDPQLAGNSGE
ncbi:MAG: hypothetical protein MR867_03785 [Eubacterium sp.]|nr:hypothetical protein [Eubacterium sp.]MDD7209641.1 hypothetical protein [Lachnospiraceae bacterium]MDY5497825.1 hypothetical protein [Anaerobutyricum sp.]